MTKRTKQKFVTPSPEEILSQKRASISLHNFTKNNLQIHNNKIVTFGPQKGEWSLYRNIDLHPHQKSETDLLENETHQLMIYSIPDSELFLYKIPGYDLVNGILVKLYDDHFELVAEAFA